MEKILDEDNINGSEKEQGIINGANFPKNPKYKTPEFF